MRTEDPVRALEQEITAGLTELRGLLSNCSTASVVGSCLAHNLSCAAGNYPEGHLASSVKQISFLLGVLLSGPEPTDPITFGEVEWERVKSILQELFYAYMHLYMPTKEQVGSLEPEWYRVREVSMLAFLHYFNTALLASVEQIAERIGIYLVPFDTEIAEVIGISASKALAICRWICDQLQGTADDLHSIAQVEREQRISLLEKARSERWSLETLRKAAREPIYFEHAKKLFQGLEDIGSVSLPDLRRAFPEMADTFWALFSVQRGDAPEIRYPTEQSIHEVRPLVRISEERACCPFANGLFSALLTVGERTLLQSPARNKFLRARDKALEDETLTKLKAFLSPKAKIWSGVYETPDSKYEHDVIAIDDGLCIVVEAKASPPIEPFRDPEKAFVRLRDAFRSETGIQKAFEQGNRILRKLRAGEVVQLYDERGYGVGRLIPRQLEVSIAVCVTRDNFGPLATNLALLLEKSPTDPYPWVVNIIDLSNLAEGWSYFSWGTAEFRKYLEQRILLHGKVFSDDELDYAGYFMRHGSFDSAINTQADLVQLNPDYSSLFDRIYEHLHLDGPPVTLEQTDPVLVDFRRSLISDQPVFVDAQGHTISREKIGRNERCPCGSGKKYKRCCGADR